MADPLPPSAAPSSPPPMPLSSQHAAPAGSGRTPQSVDRRPFWYFLLAVALTFALAVYAFKRPGPPTADDDDADGAPIPSRSVKP